MATNDELSRANEIIVSNSGALSEYAGTEFFGLLTGLLGAMQVVYMHDLVSVDPDELKFRQGALRQVMSLKDSLEQGGVVSPKV